MCGAEENQGRDLDGTVVLRDSGRSRGLAYKDEVWRHCTVVTSSGVSPCGLHTDLFPQLFISRIQRQPRSVG